jgi:hypothetical protein
MNLLPLDDSRWATYHGGYRQPYNAAPLIRQLRETGATDQFWETVWLELHHQGDVGEASYAMVPYLVDHQARSRNLDEQVFHFICTVDLAQPQSGNPRIPAELELAYATALRQLPVDGTELIRRGCHENLVIGIAASTALAAGHRVLARAYLELGRVDALKYLRELNGFEPDEHDD